MFLLWFHFVKKYECILNHFSLLFPQTPYQSRRWLQPEALPCLVPWVYHTRWTGYARYVQCVTIYLMQSNVDLYLLLRVGPDGMEKFCEDIGVEPENIVMLVLAYKMGATQMGFFSQQEWLKGLTDLECDSTAKMVVKLDYLRSILNDPNSFKSIYRYAYDFAKVRLWFWLWSKLGYIQILFITIAGFGSA